MEENQSQDILWRGRRLRPAGDQDKQHGENFHKSINTFIKLSVRKLQCKLQYEVCLLVANRFCDHRWVRCNTERIHPKVEYWVTELLKGCEYEFRVSAENEVGAGDPSPPSKPVFAKDPIGNVTSS